jgi:hypothetical protein
VTPKTPTGSSPAGWCGGISWRNALARSDSNGLEVVEKMIKRRVFSVVITLTVKGSDDGLHAFARFVRVRVRASRRIAGGDAGVPGGWMRG